MWKLKEKLFGYFGPAEKLLDTYKDAEGKGLDERFHEALGADYDDNTAPYLDNLVDNTVHYRTIMEKFLTHAEDSVGNPVVLSSDADVRRKILRFWLSLCKIKGTIKSYEVLFKILGFDSVTITEHLDHFGLDSPTTLDSTLRRLDSGCRPCSSYSIALTGTILMGLPLIDAIGNVITFCEPINASLREITYNGSMIEPLISIFVDSEGNLILDNTNVPTMTASIDGYGNVILSGPNDFNYTADNANGEVLHI